MAEITLEDPLGLMIRDVVQVIGLKNNLEIAKGEKFGTYKLI